ncbi:hypothetical protein CO038_03975 [Candidatus Pacearchaeota archaeon CG_4_9_14_0_2_um_filter_39_13]|nr:hypothetical protein [Candidatus Pacearchaeota archaeon]OIO44300.1 MAG: hypothetical protein AUJ64_00385 [Candidatus Pacearchaeota archaeon CG1_02_39_14]PJC44343.1 MAG: hypothetical protein CO038_03975 [Candidatus Pacearchaeota archaeon CG_4_9_14_0_2_um_filter_39_13]
MKNNSMWECAECGKIEYGHNPPQECEECWKLNSFVQVDEDEMDEKREADVVEEIRQDFKEEDDE